ncbi:MAG TPA: hypothetical protein VG602_02975 [Actinomycetota bacterium]|nr:hypothetical protein [Actinomycetota bacterium]
MFALLAVSCGGDEQEANPPTATDAASPSPGGNILEPDSPATPSPGTPEGETPTTPEETGETPKPGEKTEPRYEVVGRGADSASERVLPRVLLATSPGQGAATGEASPAPGAGARIRAWDEYGERAVVAVLGGSQPDSAYRVLVRSVDVIKNGTILLVSGTIDRKKGPASQVITIPWVILSVDAEAVDTVERCTVALEGATPFTTECP